MANDWHYAVCVGVDQYPRVDAGRRNLRFPEADAFAMEKWLLRADGGDLPAANVRCITRTRPVRPPPVPMRDEVYEAIYALVEQFNDALKALPEAERKAAWDRSRFYFYVSGHGLDEEGDDTVVVMANARKNDYSMNISTRGVLRALVKHRVFGEVIVFADACRELTDSKVPEPALDFKWARSFNDPIRPLHFYGQASRTQMKAFEPKAGAPIANGIFTHALLDGLQTRVISGTIDSQRLAEYLFNAVPTLAQTYAGQTQRPRIEHDRGIVFGVPVRGISVTLRVPPGSRFAHAPGLDALLFVDDTIRRFPFVAASPGTLQTDLPAGHYMIVATGASPADAGLLYHPLPVLTGPIDANLP